MKTRFRKVYKQIAILEEEINKEKKRQNKELQNLQAALDENQKMENLQENVNSIMVCYFLTKKISLIVNTLILCKNGFSETTPKAQNEV